MAQSTSQFLVKLSEACKKHAAFHFASPSAVDSNSSGDISTTTVSDKCQRELSSLSDLIPKLESTFAQQDGQDGGSSSSNRAVDIAHICAFYQSILGGVYCPHSPQLFGDQMHVSKVLPRTYFLLKQLTTTSLLQNIKATDKKAQSKPVQAKEQRILSQPARLPTAVADTIVETVSALLNFASDPSVQSCLFQDTLLLCQDLSVLQEIARDQTYKGHDANIGGGVFLSPFPEAEIVVFENTLTKSRQQTEAPGNSTNETNSHNDGDEATGESTDEFLLDVTSHEVLFLLQYCAFGIMRSLMRANQHRVTFFETESAVPGESPALVFCDIFAAIRCTVFVQDELHRHDVPLHLQNPAALSCTLRCSIAAISVLEHLVEDWHINALCPSLTVLTEACILVARAIESFLSTDSKKFDKPPLLHQDCYAIKLMHLSQKLFLDVPVVNGISARATISLAIHNATLPYFCDCISILSQWPSDHKVPSMINLGQSVLQIVYVSAMATIKEKKVDDQGYNQNASTKRFVNIRRTLSSLLRLAVNPSFHGMAALVLKTVTTGADDSQVIFAQICQDYREIQEHQQQQQQRRVEMDDANSTQKCSDTNAISDRDISIHQNSSPNSSQDDAGRTKSTEGDLARAGIKRKRSTAATTAERESLKNLDDMNEEYDRRSETASVRGKNDCVNGELFVDPLREFFIQVLLAMDDLDAKYFLADPIKWQRNIYASRTCIYLLLAGQKNPSKAQGTTPLLAKFMTNLVSMVQSLRPRVGSLPAQFEHALLDAVIACCLFERFARGGEHGQMQYKDSDLSTMVIATVQGALQHFQSILGMPVDDAEQCIPPISWQPSSIYSTLCRDEISQVSICTLPLFKRYHMLMCLLPSAAVTGSLIGTTANPDDQSLKWLILDQILSTASSFGEGVHHCLLLFCSDLTEHGGDDTIAFQTSAQHFLGRLLRHLQSRTMQEDDHSLSSLSHLFQFITTCAHLNSSLRRECINQARQFLDSPGQIQAYFVDNKFPINHHAMPVDRSSLPKSQRLFLESLLSFCDSLEMAGNGNHAMFKWRCISLICRSIPPDYQDIELGTTMPLLLWLLRTLGSDADSQFQVQASHDLAQILQMNECCLLVVSFATPDELVVLRECKDQPLLSENVKRAVERIVESFFCQLDSFLDQKIADDETRSVVHTNKITMESAIQILTSICKSTNLESMYGPSMFKKAFHRIVQLSTAQTVEGEPPSAMNATNPSTLNRIVSVRYRAFGCMAQFHRATLRADVMVSGSLCTSMAYVLFRDLLAATTSIDEESTRIWFEKFVLYNILAFRNYRATAGGTEMLAVACFVEEIIPSVLARHVIDGSDELFKRCMRLREQMLSQERSFATMAVVEPTERCMVSGGPTLRCGLSSGNLMTVSQMKNRVRNLTVIEGSDLIERTVALMLRELDANSQALAVFCKDYLVISDPMVVTTKWEKPILKRLIWDLGNPSESSSRSEKALHATSALLFQSRGSSAGSTLVTSQWISKHFLYLLVNILQLKWKEKSLIERLQSFVCLAEMLKYLLPADSSLYFTQIVAIVAASTELPKNAGCKTDRQRNLEAELCLRSTEALASFITIVAKYSILTVAQSLTTVIATLIGILETSKSISAFAASRCNQVVVELLEFMTQGAIGKDLSAAFDAVPFMSTAAELETARLSLKKRGVEFDSFNSFDIGDDGTSSMTSESSSKTPNRLLRFKRCMATALPLMSSENVGVRRATLKHLKELLFNHRFLFRAVLDEEGCDTTKRYLTENYSETRRFVQQGESTDRGVVTQTMECLLGRCRCETDEQARLLLTVCLGEMGAIGEDKLGDLKMSSGFSDMLGSLEADASSWRLTRPPWQCRDVNYQLYLVTKLLVGALKGASDSTDQHKIAFAIQELLILLDSSAQRHHDDAAKKEAKGHEMTPWLQNKLKEARVLGTVEPFWSSKFKEKTDLFKVKTPPFFSHSKSYFHWISTFCRWMIARSNNTPGSVWKALFNACRAAVRSRAGLVVSEFILPFLVLDCICFGTPGDAKLILDELGSALAFDERSCSMNFSGCQRAVNSVFMVIDTLNFWSQKEIEERYKNSQNRSSSKGKRKQVAPSLDALNGWSADLGLDAVDETLKAIPLDLRARAAHKAGMYARAQQLLEWKAREKEVDVHFGHGGSTKSELASTSTFRGCLVIENHTLNADWAEMTGVLAELDDFETMISISQNRKHVNAQELIRENIRIKEARGQWEAALEEYERAMQLEMNKDNTNIAKGSMRCLLELGHFESALNNLYGLIHRQEEKGNFAKSKEIVPLAVEAAWRLGKWQTLSELVEHKSLAGGPCSEMVDGDTSYRVAIGKAMLGLKNNRSSIVADALRSARQAVLQSLSRVARESYARCYPHLVRLHCVRELEEASSFLCPSTLASKPDIEALAHFSENVIDKGRGWENRLEVVSDRDSQTVISTRLALARIASEPMLEASLFLIAGKRARKLGLYNIAATSLSQAELTLSSVQGSSQQASAPSLIWPIESETAKLKNAIGMSSTALKMLGQDEVLRVVDEMVGKSDEGNQKANLNLLAISFERSRIAKVTESPSPQHCSDEVLTHRFAARLLKLTQWMMQGGLKGRHGASGLFNLIHKIEPKWEKGHFHFAKFVDSSRQSRVDALILLSNTKHSAKGFGDEMMRAFIIGSDALCQKYTRLAMLHYAKALPLGSKYLYQALPRLLSLWFEIMSIQPDVSSSTNKTKNVTLKACQEEANNAMAKNVQSIPQISFYTVIPQLISRVIHHNNDTSHIVQYILQRVLTKFPHQSMWPLAWLRSSKNEERCRIGKTIFKKTQESFAIGKKNSNPRLQQLLVSSVGLFKYLQHLAVYENPDSRSTFMSVQPWSGQSHISEFLPPVQAALTVSSLTTSSSGRKDFFPRVVPRIRALSSNVGVMASKAKPKKLKAFMVPGTLPCDSMKNSASSKSVLVSSTSSAIPAKGDIGELHFLLKQEAKGDLRKDARVQDLANVINRLMISSVGGKRTSRSRYLQVRTFAVTCLSEDIGILEWVPNTDSMRNLVSASYNPQAHPTASRRRGGRLANFGDATLRSNFEKSQSAFFKNGNLTSAAAMFVEKCLKPNPPLLYWWFVHKFSDPHAWYEARTRFTMSAALWSGVGHVIGLGDRHAENILVDTTSGACVHVDFDCIFDKGLNLPRPEVVPFRLTPNMIDAFGPTGEEGVYKMSLQTVMTTLRDSRDTLLSVLEPFVKDPVIDWKRHRTQQKKAGAVEGQNVVDDRQMQEAKRSVNVIDERLQGIYNLRNPNLRKYRNPAENAVSSSSSEDCLLDNECEHNMHLFPLSVEGQVHKMISEATSPENLMQMYVGWMPWV